MSKPCDVKDRRTKLPCVSPVGELCYGRQYWDKARGVQPKQLRYMGDCPWIEQVREYWKRKGYGK